jgi:serine/threonine protein kinase
MDDSAVLAEMAEEFAARWRRGERPEVEEYAARAPALAERVRALFPTLMLLEGLAAAAPAEPTPRAEMPRPGETFGAYRVGGEIGRGGMGVVYEAEQISLGRRVALKVLPLRGGDSGARLERFLREARTAASLHHGNVVPVFDVGQCGGVPYYAMQLIDGVSLDRLGHAAPAPTTAEGDEQAVQAPAAAAVRVPQGQERFRWAADVGRQAAEGLAHAHQRGVIHRDIKPSNLMIDARGNVWITDFGLARRLEEDVALTASGQVVGTPRYASPEQAAAAKRPVDHRTDVYSLGATLYELVTRRPAFDGPTPLDVLLSILERQPVPPRKLDPAIPRDLETIVLKAMSKRPEDRYQTAHEMAEDLRRFLDGEPVRARRIGPVGKAVRWARRNPALAAMAALVSLSLTAGVVASTLFAFHAESQRARAVHSEAVAGRRADAESAARRRADHNLYVARANLAATAWRDGEDEHVRDLLDLMRPAGGEDRRGWEWHFLDRQVNTPVRAALADRPGAKGLFHAFLSRDARRIVLNCPRHEGRDVPPCLEVRDTETGRLIGRRRAEGQVFRDDARAAAWRDGRKVLVWDVDAGRTTAYEAPGGCAALCPSGERLAFVTENPRVVALLDTKTGQTLRNLQQADGARPWRWLRFSPDGKWLAAIGESTSIREGGGVTIWEIESGRLALQVAGSEAAMSRAGQAVVARGETLRHYDLASGRERGLLELAEAKSRFWHRLDSSDDGLWLAAFDERSRLWVFSLGDAQPPRLLPCSGWTLGWDPHLFAFRGRALLRLVEKDAILEEWDLSERGRQWFPTEATVERPSDVASARDNAGSRLAFASWRRGGFPSPGAYGKVEVFATHDPRSLVSSPLGQSYDHVAVALQGAGKTVAWAGLRNSRLHLSADSQKLAARFSLWMPTGGLPDLFRVAYQASEFLGRLDVEVRDVAAGRVLLRESLANEASPDSVRGEFSPDGRYFVLALPNRMVAWDVTAGRRVAVCERELVIDVRFLPDGRLAVVSYEDNRVWASLWEVDGPRRIWRRCAWEERPGREIGTILVRGGADGLALLAYTLEENNAGRPTEAWAVLCLSPRDGAERIAEEVPSNDAEDVGLALGRGRLALGVGKRLLVWDTSTGEKLISRGGFDLDHWALVTLPGDRLGIVDVKQGGVHVHLLDGQGEHLARLALPRKQARTPAHVPRSPDAWVSGQKLRILHRATSDTWELHTLDGTPR